MIISLPKNHGQPRINGNFIILPCFFHVVIIQLLFTNLTNGQDTNIFIKKQTEENGIGQNSITFKSLNNFGVGRFTTRFGLNKYNKSWTLSGYRNYIFYANVISENYKLNLHEANSNDDFHAQTKEPQDFIDPPWRKTIWAYFIGISIFILAIAWVDWFQRKRWNLKIQLKLEHREAERLKELDLFKSRLYTNITHEFRTPLTVIIGLTEKVTEHFNSKDIAKFNNANEIVQRNANQLLNLVNQMLDISRLESKSLHLNQVNGDVIFFIKNLIEMYESHAANHYLSLNFESRLQELFMDFDPDNLQKIISNLLSNAIKFTVRGEVKVLVSDKILRNKACISIQVRDSGIGIAKEDIPNIFDRFFQTKNTATISIEGSGIGMALVKELVELMEGTVKIKSQLGQGTQIEVKLPITNYAKPIQQLKQHFTSSITEAKPMSIELRLKEENVNNPLVLVIEDNQDVMYYLNTCLQGNYQLINASDGARGISKAIESIPDIIISDVLMPRKTGYEVCEILKQDIRTSHIPIILLTAKADIYDKIDGISHGADAYMIKPFNVDELLVRVENLIKSRKILIEKFRDQDNVDEGNLLHSEKENTFLNNLDELILNDLDNPDLNVNKVCELLNMSRTQLHRKIKALTNKSITAYIRSYRLHKAKKLIQESNLTIQQISFEAGFSDPSYFHRSFVKEFGKKPTDLRK